MIDEYNLHASRFNLTDQSHVEFDFRFPAKKKAASDTFVDGKANTQATEINEARSEALSGVINSIERSFGKGSILRLGETPHMVVEKFSSGSITLDMALGGVGLYTICIYL